VIAKRIGAVLVAVALIAGAFFLRRNVLEDDEVSSAPATDSISPQSSGELVCITELAEVCRALAATTNVDVVVEDALVTLDRLAALDDDAAAPSWLTVAPFPTMLDELRTSSGRDPLALQGEVLAATQLGIAAPTGGRFDQLATACPDTPIWRCLGEQAGTPWAGLGGEASWSAVRPSVGAADRSAVALASFAAAVAGYFGTPEFSRATWDLDPDFISWVRRLVRTVPIDRLSGNTPLLAMAARASALDMAATTAAELAAFDPAATRFEGNYPAPAMWLEAVLAAPADVEQAALVDDATTALTEAGWVPPAEVTGQVPSATTMLALRTLWQEAT